MNICEAVKTLQINPTIFHASTSEMFGPSHTQALNERSKMEPCSPYAVSKLSAYHLCKYYRQTYKLNVVQAISFNHESPFRHEMFVTRKITTNVARGKLFELGNVDSVRDWGHARDYCRAYYKIVNQGKQDCYVVSTG